MWILKWLPDWIFYAIFLAGLIGYAATYLLKYIPIPFIFVNRKPIQIVSVLAIIFGTFMSGAIYDNQAWLDRVKEMEEKVAAAEAQSKQENVKIVEKVVTKVQVIKERNNDIIKYVNANLVQYDETCKIPQPFIEALNRAAEEVK